MRASHVLLLCIYLRPSGKYGSGKYSLHSEQPFSLAGLVALLYDVPAYKCAHAREREHFLVYFSLSINQETEQRLFFTYTGCTSSLVCFSVYQLALAAGCIHFQFRSVVGYLHS